MKLAKTKKYPRVFVFREKLDNKRGLPQNVWHVINFRQKYDHVVWVEMHLLAAKNPFFEICFFFLCLLKTTMGLNGRSNNFPSLAISLSLYHRLTTIFPRENHSSKMDFIYTRIYIIFFSCFSFLKKGWAESRSLNRKILANVWACSLCTYNFVVVYLRVSVSHTFMK